VLRPLIPAEFYKELFAVLEPTLQRSIPAFTAPNAFSEIPTVYAIRNWNHVLIAHRIVQVMIEDREVFGPLLTPEFGAKLVHQLETPVSEEREEVEAALHLLLAHYAGFRRPMLRIMLAKLVAYLDGVKWLTLAIGPILRLLLTYFATLRGPVKQSNFLLFRTVFYPLFTMELADFYEAALTDLSAFFQGRDSATAFWCLRYLKNHWPCSSTHKQMLFFRQAALLIPMLPMTMFDRVGPVLLRTIRKALTSEHFQVAMSAALFCAAPEFMSLFRSIPDDVSKFLIISARVATEHWNQETGEVAKFLVGALRDFERASKPATRARTANNPRKRIRMGWGDVVEIAIEADRDLDADHEREKVDNWLAQVASGLGTS
jgi:translation initiation factor IF-1